MDKQNLKAKTSATRRGGTVRTRSLRGIEHCRVVEIGVEGVAECTKWGPVNCSHALPFGYCFLCLHPHVDEIIETSKKDKLFSQA